MRLIETLKLGDRVVVRKREGGQRVGIVDEIRLAGDHDDGIKNGMAGIGYVADNGDSWWCYENQIVRKESE